MAVISACNSVRQLRQAQALHFLVTKPPEEQGQRKGHHAHDLSGLT
jgi:hypothetical protein